MRAAVSYRRSMKVPHAAGAGAGTPDHGRAVGSGPTALGARRANDAASLVGSPVPTARATADAAVVGWNAVAQALVPIIGSSSVTALYRRCLVSVGVDCTWLPSVTAEDLPENDWTALHASMSRQTPTEASQAATSLFLSFQHLLGSLIGPSLTEQLLHPVSALLPNGSAEQDTLS
jgi:hypothetical protein